MKNFLLVCNFKENIVDEKLYQKTMGGDNYNNVILCPNFCDIKTFSKLKVKNHVLIGAQNVSEFENGAYTGEVNAKMLKNAGADFCIVGHSERKKYNFETLSQINLKVKQLLLNGITPIVCVGEETSQNMSQTEFAIRYVLSELAEILKDVDISQIIVAYEPIWAIGTGNNATMSHIKQVVDAIKKYTGVSFVLYGGSFNESNFQEIASINSLDGALIGGASLKPEVICNMQKRLKEIL